MTARREPAGARGHGRRIRVSTVAQPDEAPPALCTLRLCRPGCSARLTQAGVARRDRRRVRPPGRPVHLIAGLAIAIVACGQPVPSSSVPDPSVVPVASVADLPVAELAEAQRLRREFGLRADTDWIRRVAADPQSRDMLGIPLMPDEIADLVARQASVDRILPLVRGYGFAHPEAWAGLEIDQDRAGILVARFSADVDRHRAALRELVGPDALIEVVKVGWSEAALKRFAEAIGDGTEWLRDIPAVEVGFGVDHGLNRVLLEVSSPHPDAVALIRAHYGDPPWLVVRSDGTGKGLLTPGTIVVVARDGAGRPVKGLHCSFTADYGTIYAEGWATDAKGACRASLRSTGYWVELSRGSGDARTIVGLSRAVVRSGTEVRLEVTVNGE